MHINQNWSAQCPYTKHSGKKNEKGIEETGSDKWKEGYTFPKTLHNFGKNSKKLSGTLGYVLC